MSRRETYFVRSQRKMPKPNHTFPTAFSHQKNTKTRTFWNDSRESRQSRFPPLHPLSIWQNVSETREGVGRMSRIQFTFLGKQFCLFDGLLVFQRYHHCILWWTDSTAVAHSFVWPLERSDQTSVNTNRSWWQTESRGASAQSLFTLHLLPQITLSFKS